MADQQTFHWSDFTGPNEEIQKLKERVAYLEHTIDEVATWFEQVDLIYNWDSDEGAKMIMGMLRAAVPGGEDE